ncbi:MAG TPA: hypothetical protein VN520_30215 [Streptomyces sp.]|uniref:hypothetical protein n=1 Tax=Streptomyces sp. TaxID=1931 RepID=UPI002BB00B24|nr:hypothetical protein [Streptomyces sp.]HWU10588.1 hypothetical protein [Streptomyces sp.]
MSEQTPSQAEGEREPDTGTADVPSTSGPSEVPRTTPSQAEGDSTEQDETGAVDTAGD